jgi:hypothetical protein
MKGQRAADLEDADTESDLGIQFFLNLPAAGSDPGQASQTQPFFLPGISKAGMVRVLVLLAEDSPVRSKEDDVRQIDAIITLAQGMIDTVTATVTSAHIINLVTTTMPAAEAADEHPRQPGQPAEPVVLYQGYWHEERGIQLQFFSAGDDVQKSNDPRLAHAKAEAETALEQGVTAELADLGIPQFQELVQTWKNQVVSPIVQTAPRLSSGLRSDPA